MTQERNHGSQLHRYLIHGFSISILSFFIFAAPSLRAQDSAITATLNGTVRDAAGAIIPGATITLRNLTTNQIRSTTSESDGSYRISAIAVGEYEVRAEAAGFASYSIPK